jgi:hypothetical protein
MWIILNELEDLTKKAPSKFTKFVLEIKKMAGLAGFEPTNDGVKVRCLTAWL